MVTIKPIALSEDKLEVLQRILASNRIMDATKEGIIKKLANGLCCICRGIPAFEVTYGVTDGGATRIERYCAPCRDRTFNDGKQG